MTKINLGRVQGVSAFYSTNTDQNANLPLGQIKPSQIKPFVGDYILFANGNIRAIEQIANQVAICGEVLFSLKGAAGFGLSKIEQTISNESGGANIVKFMLQDGTPFEVQIKNGKDGLDGKDGTNGKDGVGISSVLKTNTSGKVDTYTITLTNGNMSTFSVVNGVDGKDGIDGKDGENGTNGLTIVNAYITEIESNPGGSND